VDDDYPWFLTRLALVALGVVIFAVVLYRAYWGEFPWS
jgi:hypothetical protein